jgi:hypothetical protein
MSGSPPPPPAGLPLALSPTERMPLLMSTAEEEVKAAANKHMPAMSLHSKEHRSGATSEQA